MRAREWMTTEVESIKPRATLAQARALLEEKRINQLPVLAQGRLVGIITDRDLRDAFPSVFEAPRRRRAIDPNVDPEKVTVEEVMTPNVVTIGPDDTLEAAARVMRRERIGALPVVEGGRLVGLVTRSDILDAYIALCEESAAEVRAPRRGQELS